MKAQARRPGDPGPVKGEAVPRSSHPSSRSSSRARRTSVTAGGDGRRRRRVLVVVVDGRSRVSTRKRARLILESPIGDTPAAPIPGPSPRSVPRAPRSGRPAGPPRRVSRRATSEICHGDGRTPIDRERPDLTLVARRRVGASRSVSPTFLSLAPFPTLRFSPSRCLLSSLTLALLTGRALPSVNWFRLETARICPSAIF